MTVKLALPKGRLQASTAALLERAGLRLSHYEERSRSYRPKAEGPFFAKVFQERDIAIQVAIGNYDLGICGGEWIEELLAKYPSDAVVKVRSLGYGVSRVYAAVSRFSGIESLAELKAFSLQGEVYTVSEYPNLAEAFALRLRLSRFKVFPVWGAAEVYPPENAHLALVRSEDDLSGKDLLPLAAVLETQAFLIANKRSLEGGDLGAVLGPLSRVEMGEETKPLTRRSAERLRKAIPWGNGDFLRVALPDGHQQPPTARFLEDAGLSLRGYQTLSTRRPPISLEGVCLKVIRPQDMPLQVANGNFDLAITGRDWLLDHLYRFPSSPVEELMSLDFGKVRIVAVVSADLAPSSVAEVRERIKAGSLAPLRLASEYVNIADKYARDHHLAPYKVIPTWGASEAFLPEDADLLIENTQTGATLAEHRLKVIDTLFESSACLIGNKKGTGNRLKEERKDRFIEMLRRGKAGQG